MSLYIFDIYSIFPWKKDAHSKMINMLIVAYPTIAGVVLDQRDVQEVSPVSPL